ncbi:hypothetical protein SPI_03621 [Niveomyces insectorum RCEF 264]|uniref:Uncharacterized protein n=1 Tax=Niveomyces insectorum RCEF 264 TaxID=1081102 RepID=A0A167W889_9HYPO|nr:hypothetical protein SPI_03621 [Niveomyces insectorum RCEF 264]
MEIKLSRETLAALTTAHTVRIVFRKRHHFAREERLPRNMMPWATDSVSEFCEILAKDLGYGFRACRNDSPSTGVDGSQAKSTAGSKETIGREEEPNANTMGEPASPRSSDQSEPVHMFGDAPPRPPTLPTLSSSIHLVHVSQAAYICFDVFVWPADGNSSSFNAEQQQQTFAAIDKSFKQPIHLATRIKGSDTWSVQRQVAFDDKVRRQLEHVSQLDHSPHPLFWDGGRSYVYRDGQRIEIEDEEAVLGTELHEHYERIRQGGVTALGETVLKKMGLWDVVANNNRDVAGNNV